MDSLRHPVGRLPAAVYWRRRIIALVALLAALALILFACSGSSGQKKSPVGTSTPTGAVSTAAAGGPTGTASSPNATPPASADGSAGASSGSAGASGTPSAGQSAGASGGTAGGVDGTAAPGSCQLKLSVASGVHEYINGEQPVFTVAIVNNGTADCTADVGPKSLVLTVYSGSDRIWSSADCATGKQDLRSLTPGDLQQIPVTWPRTRSTPGCPSGAAVAATGTYYAQATLGTGTGTPQEASFTAQQTFVLKSGS